MVKVDWDNVGCTIFLGIVGAFLYVLAFPYLPLAVQGGIDTLLLIAFGFMCRGAWQTYGDGSYPRFWWAVWLTSLFVVSRFDYYGGVDWLISLWNMLGEKCA